MVSKSFQPKPPPILIYHTSFSPYLPFSLWQNQRANPDRELILIGNEAGQIQGLNYQHVDETGYRDLLDEMKRSYRHMADCQVADEQRCLGRWFVLSEFLRKEAIGEFYFMDSDFLLFASLGQFEAHWKDDEMIGTPLLWGFSFLRNPQPVHDFCQWVLELYRSDLKRQALRKKYAEQGSGLAEMGLMTEFFREAGLTIRNVTWENPEADPCFDEGFFGSSYRYHPQDFRQIRQAGPGQAVYYERDGIARRLLGLHFVGHQKNQIPGFTGWTLAVIRSFFRPNYRRNLKWLLQYLWNGRVCRGRLQRQSRGLVLR